MNGPLIATIEIRTVPFMGGYAFDVERAGVPLEDHHLARHHYPQRIHGAISISDGLRKIGLALDEIEEAGP